MYSVMTILFSNGKPIRKCKWNFKHVENWGLNIGTGVSSFGYELPSALGRCVVVQFKILKARHSFWRPQRHGRLVGEDIHYVYV